MAYIVGRKVVKDTDAFDNFAYGITLPIKRGETGYFEQSFESTVQAKSNLINLLRTSKGERIMQPDFGVGLETLLFEQMTDGILEEKLEILITDSVNYWLPYISITEIDIEMTDEMKDNNTANMSIVFKIGSDSISHTASFTIEG